MTNEQNIQTLTIITQKTVPFYEDELIAIQAANKRVYVSVRHLADALGLDRRGVTRRIERDSLLYKGYFKGDMMTPKGNRQANWLRVDLVPLWLTGVDTNKVKPEIQEKLERYREEAASVLWDAFQAGRLTSSTSFNDLLERNTDAVQAYKMALAVVELARSQVLLEARLDNYEERLAQIEATLGDVKHHITPAQASRISQSVKAIAMELSKRTGRNEYGGVYGELYRVFEVTSYKEMPASRYNEAMEFLTEWHQSLVDNVIF
jgi:hypothetical protein